MKSIQWTDNNEAIEYPGKRKEKRLLILGPIFYEHSCAQCDEIEGSFYSGFFSLNLSYIFCQVGACIVNEDKRIVGIGYNGFPNGISDDSLPWSRLGSNYLETKYPYVIHAEANSIMNSSGRDLKGSTIYTTLYPCCECAKLIIQSGIDQVIYLENKYPAIENFIAAEILFSSAGIRAEPFRENINVQIKRDVL